jgi:hypothetical protein
MEVDLQSLFGLHVSAQLYSLAETATRSLPQHLDTYFEGAIGPQRQTTSLCNPLDKNDGGDIIGCYFYPNNNNTLDR